MTVSSVSRSLDLRSVAAGRRSDAWKRVARDWFPGLKINALSSDPSAGSIAGGEFGTGELWSIVSPALQLEYLPGAAAACSPPSFSLMLQLQGRTAVSQGKRACTLAADDMCVLDGVAPFRLEVEAGSSQVVFLRMPRRLALSRHPGIERGTARQWASGEAGVTLLRTVLLGLLNAAADLSQAQCTAALAAIAYLMGVPEPAREPAADDGNWRAVAALSHISERLSDPGLTAEAVAAAQGICRRRLDEILREATGSSLTPHIWRARLVRAARELRDPSRASSTVTQIAFSLGFVDASHFTRTFRRRYGCAPRDWRKRG